METRLVYYTTVWFGSTELHDEEILATYDIQRGSTLTLQFDPIGKIISETLTGKIITLDVEPPCHGKCEREDSR